eukprot:11801130-Alexandrium_andersonii.AAC.1
MSAAAHSAVAQLAPVGRSSHRWRSQVARPAPVPGWLCGACPADHVQQRAFPREAAASKPNPCSLWGSTAFRTHPDGAS